MNRWSTIGLTLIATLTISPTARAHFPWVMVNEQGDAMLFFGESPADRTYKLPEPISKAQLSVLDGEGRLQNLGLEAVENDNMVGMKSTQSVPDDACLISKVTYGVYHGSRLDYYTQHHSGKLPQSRGAYGAVAKHLKLYAEVVDTESGVDVFVFWDGKPLQDAKVTLYCSDGHEEGSGETDQDGSISFDDRQVEDGLNGILVGHTASNESGTLGDTPYKATSHYLTMTFVDPEDSAGSRAEISVSSDVYPAVPVAVTSFGAAVAGDAVYIYGGHTGRAHEYYAEAQARTLWRLDLKDPKSWEELGEGPGLQGLAMVAHQGKLYRLGGFTAKNKDGEEADLWSQASASRFDPGTQSWTALPDMPEPRSSFDAAVLGDTIYVVGGWSMQGGRDSRWHESAYALDLSKDQLRWQAVPKPPFQRRALSIAAHDGKIYAIGGMQKQGGPTTRVDVFDTASQSWQEGPAIHGEGMEGFGSSSFAVGGRLYVSTYSGKLQRLAEDGDSWEIVATLDRDRFFHRLLPLSPNRLLAIGGASMSSGKFEEVDVIEIR